MLIEELTKDENSRKKINEAIFRFFNGEASAEVDGHKIRAYQSPDKKIIRFAFEEELDNVFQCNKPSAYAGGFSAGDNIPEWADKECYQL